MLNKTRIMMTALALVGLSVPCANLAAQYKSGSYSKSIGNSWLGGSVHGNGTAILSPYSAYVGFRTSAKAKVLKKTLSIASIRAYASTNKESRSTAYFSVSLGGKTRISERASKTLRKSFAKPDLRLASIKNTYWLGPVPVRLSASVGVGLRAGTSLGVVDASRVGVAGFGQAWANASASGGVGIWFASAGVSCNG
ncbi:MAG: hypothetical protein QF412_09805, partial [Planctomycetota bacterium]|nr:hypothetical protein [Planctomycetota bacterium]